VSLTCTFGNTIQQSATGLQKQTGFYEAANQIMDGYFKKEFL